ncbi:MAG TPA: hypothetical protein VEW04_10995 [Allosphingosinicella sp.]|nr:hypothetical protein [Allosphingosinicella sp.]
MRHALFLTIAILSLAAAKPNGSAAATGAGQSSAQSRLDDLVERFEAMVERNAPDHVEPWSPPEFREEMLRLNPGREHDVDEFVGKMTDCQFRVMAEAMPRASRASARALGEERLGRLVEFLEGPGGEAHRRFQEGDRGAMSEAQQEEWDRLRPDYGTFMYSIPNHVDRDSWARMMRCHEDEASRLHLRTQ